MIQILFSIIGVLALVVGIVLIGAIAVCGAAYMAIEECKGEEAAVKWLESLTKKK